MTERYPGYDVLAKRDTPSWNDRHAPGDRRAPGASTATSRGSSPKTNGRR